TGLVKVTPGARLAVSTAVLASQMVVFPATISAAVAPGATVTVKGIRSGLTQFTPSRDTSMAYVALAVTGAPAGALSTAPSAAPRVAEANQVMVVLASPVTVSVGVSPAQTVIPSSGISCGPG